ncbi:MAG: peptidoglycan-binding domain-containing protein [Methylovirgula sp.]
MREALARSDHDFVLSEPRARHAPPRRRHLAALRAIARFICRLAAFPNRIGGALVFALAVAIMVNALLLQHSRHPAPLFRKSIILQTRTAAPPHPPHEKPSERVEQAVVPPLPHDAIGQLLKTETPLSRPTDAPERTLVSRHHHGTREHAAIPQVHTAARDPISQLLKAGSTQPIHAEDQPKVVLGVQQALVKLGFVLRADGHMGAVTRHAIKQYEHDHGLKTEGELTPKLLRRLAAESGINIE